MTICSNSSELKNSEISAGLIDFAWEEMQILMHEIRILKTGYWCARENGFCRQEDINLAMDFQAFTMDLVNERCEAFYENLHLMQKVVKGDQNSKVKLLKMLEEKPSYNCNKLIKIIARHTTA